MKCFRVVMHGITRDATDADPDGAGFYTARSLEAESEEHAVESALRSVRSNPEAGSVVLCSVALAAVAACSTAIEVTEPTCARPVAVSGKWDERAPGYLVGYDADVTDPNARTSELSRRLGFEAESVLSSGGFYVSVLSASALARLRCEPGIRYIEHNARAQIGKATQAEPKASLRDAHYLAQLEQAERAWTVANVSGYRYRLVKGGVFGYSEYSVRFKDGRCMARSRFVFEKAEPWRRDKCDGLTMPELFSQVRGQLVQGTQHVEIQFDDALGYIVTFSAEPDTDLSDQLWYFRVSKFRATTGGI